MVTKQHFFKCLEMTDDQRERLWDFFQKNVKFKDEGFQIHYKFTSVGPILIAKYEDKELWINEDFNP